MRIRSCVGKQGPRLAWGVVFCTTLDNKSSVWFFPLYVIVTCWKVHLAFLDQPSLSCSFTFYAPAFQVSLCAFCFYTLLLDIDMLVLLSQKAGFRKVAWKWDRDRSPAQGQYHPECQRQRLQHLSPCRCIGTNQLESCGPARHPLKKFCQKSLLIFMLAN